MNAIQSCMEVHIWVVQIRVGRIFMTVYLQIALGIAGRWIPKVKGHCLYGVTERLQPFGEEGI